MISPDVHSYDETIHFLLSRVAVKESRKDYRNERELVDLGNIPIVAPFALGPIAYSYV